jgi:hypothetical protein
MAYVRRHWLFLFALALLTRIAIFASTFFSDEATYSALASRIGAGGGMPYVGAVDHKPPGIELVYAAVYAIVGRNHLLAVRLLLVAVVATTALVIGRIARRLSGPQAETGAAVLYVIASAWGLASDVQSANTELFLNLPLALAAWLLIARGSATGCAAAGVLTAIAALFKYQAALAGLGWAVIVAIDTRVAARARLARLVLLALGFAVLAAVYLGTFWLAGAWDDFAFWGWQYSFRYVAALSPGEMIGNALLYTGVIALYWSPMLIALVRPTRELLRGPLPWLGAMTLAASVGGRFYPHYFLMMLPPIVLFASAGFCARNRRGAIARKLAVAVTAAAIVASLVRPELDGYRRRSLYASREVGAWIREHTSPDALVFVWGGSPQIYYDADRVMATRFAFCNYHTGKIWGTRYFERDSPGAPELVVAEAWPELIADLEANKPEIVVDGAAGKLMFFDSAPMSGHTELATLVARDYELAATVEGVPIYIRARTRPLPP